MTKPIFTSGQRVVYSAQRNTVVGQFEKLHGKQFAVIIVPTTVLDDDGSRLVRLASLKPYYNAPSDQQRRARHAARLYKQGIRMFRLDTPQGHTFCVETIDRDAGMAVGRRLKRKTVQIVQLHQLFPEAAS